jgi:SAM-dependent methyltransferase
MSNENDKTGIHAMVATYYDDRLAAFGVSARGVDWKDEASQRLRHAQFDRLFDGDPTLSVADLGCGYGDYCAYLHERGHSGAYYGYDISAAMIEAAIAAHGQREGVTFNIASEPIEPADIIVASGIFNVRRGVPEETWERYIEETVDRMAEKARRGFGFNVLSQWSDLERRRADLHYADPARWFDRCAQRYGRSVAVLQDYGLYEFTVLCRGG